MSELTEFKVSGQLPGEAFAIELLKFIAKVIEGQPPEVKAKYWEMALEDYKAWREFWRNLTNK